MGVLLAILSTLLFIGAAFAGSKLSIKVQFAIIIVASLGLAWLHWSVAKTQLTTTGFAARNRNPNQIAQDIGYALAIIGVLNCGLVFKNVRYSAILLCLVFALFPALYLLSW